MIKARVNTYLNIRTGTPEILPDNNPNDLFFKPGDVVDVVDKVMGESYKEVNVWYKLIDGGFIWSGGIDASLEDRELIALKKQRFDEIIQNRWLRTKGEDCSIAVIDSGIEKSHPFLETRVDVKGSFSFLINNIDDAFVCENSHGTIMAGLICGNNNGNFIGLSPMSKVKSLKISNLDQGNANTLTINLNAALDFLLANNSSDIINLSLQIRPDQIDQELQDQTSIKMQQLIDKGCLIVSASGNNGFIAFPGNITSIITVGILKNGVDLKSFSNGMIKPSETGKEIDFFLETYENKLIIPSNPNPFAFFDLESSEATAIFSGIIALKKSINRDYNQKELKADILSAKKQIATLPNLRVCTIDLNIFFKT